MGEAIPRQHPAVVLRTQFKQLRALLAVALGDHGRRVAAQATVHGADTCDSPDAANIIAPRPRRGGANG
jgi:hypothetical protein